MAMTLQSIIDQVDARTLGEKTVPTMRAGDTVAVEVEVVEGSRSRKQTYEGVVIAVRGHGVNHSFVVRKIVNGLGIERTIQTFSPSIVSVEVKRHGRVRQSRIYYQRQRQGRAARIRQKMNVSAKKHRG